MHTVINTKEIDGHIVSGFQIAMPFFRNNGILNNTNLQLLYYTYSETFLLK